MHYFSFHPRHLALRTGVALACLGMLAACTTPQSLELPPTPAHAWQNSASAWDLQSASAPEPQGADRFTVPAIPQLPRVESPTHAEYAQDQALTLPQLIDIAQRENPSTRLAWNRAREAALSVGLTDALFLPVITANVVAGEQRLRVPVNLPLDLGRTHIDNKVQGTTPFVTLMWLLFDFGERDALREGAQYAALAANVLFNATHQKLIRDVTDAFYRYNAARSNLALAQQSLKQHETVLQAAQARFDAGVGTRIDIALAEQALAQGRLNVVTHQGLERTSYLALTDAMGISPHTTLQIAQPVLDQLPSAVAPLTQQRIEAVIAQRADIAAAYAAVKVTEAGQRSAQAAFLPKVYMGAGWARNNSSFDVGSLPSLGTQNAASGALIGISVPLYDGGLRSKQLSKASIAKEQAEQRLQQLQMTAVREIVGAEQVLRTALQAHDAAQELVRTASVAHAAALEAYRVGRVSLVLLTESSIQLHKAEQARSEARYAAIAAAANLAFVMGTMVSAQPDWWPQAQSATTRQP